MLAELGRDLGVTSIAFETIQIDEQIIEQNEQFFVGESINGYFIFKIGDQFVSYDGLFQSAEGVDFGVWRSSDSSPEFDGIWWTIFGTKGFWNYDEGTKSTGTWRSDDNLEHGTWATDSEN